MDYISCEIKCCERISKLLNLSPKAPVFIAIAHHDHPMSLKIHVWGCSVEMNEQSRGIQMMSGYIHCLTHFFCTLLTQSADIYVYRVYMAICTYCATSVLWVSFCGPTVYLAGLFFLAKFSSTVKGFLLLRIDSSRNCILCMSPSLPHSLIHWHTFDQRNMKRYYFLHSCLIKYRSSYIVCLTVSEEWSTTHLQTFWPYTVQVQYIF